MYTGALTLTHQWFTTDVTVAQLYTVLVELTVGSCAAPTTAVLSYTMDIVNPCTDAAMTFNKSPFPAAGDSFTYVVDTAA